MFVTGKIVLSLDSWYCNVQQYFSNVDNKFQVPESLLGNLGSCFVPGSCFILGSGSDNSTFDLVYSDWSLFHVDDADVFNSKHHSENSLCEYT